MARQVTGQPEQLRLQGKLELPQQGCRQASRQRTCADTEPAAQRPHRLWIQVAHDGHSRCTVWVGGEQAAVISTGVTG